MSIEIKTPEQIALMREAGLVVARTLGVLAAAVRPGVTTAELDAIAEAEIRAAGAIPSFKGYHGYPATICASVNERDRARHPERGGACARATSSPSTAARSSAGWHGDAAITVGVGTISAADAALLEACETALWHGLAQARAGGRLGDISHAVETSVRQAGPLRPGRGVHRPRHRQPRCTWTRQCPTTAGRAAGPADGRAWRWRSSRW